MVSLGAYKKSNLWGLINRYLLGACLKGWHFLFTSDLPYENCKTAGNLQFAVHP